MRVTRALGVVLMFVACKKLTSPLEPSTDSVPLKDIVAVTIAPHDSSADTLTGVSIIASIPLGAISRTVTFMSSKGAFVEDSGKTIMVRAVSDTGDKKHLIARTLLRDLKPDTAIVRATVGDYYDTVSVAFGKRK